MRKTMRKTKRTMLLILAALVMLSSCGILNGGPGRSVFAVAAAETPEKPESAPAEDSGKLTLLIQVRETDPAPGYILMQGETSMGFLPLPTEGETIQEILQTRKDGSVWRNVIRMTPEGFCMIEADCEGHDCIEEGEVTLENMQNRLLWNMVICAPHMLILSLYTPADAEALSKQWLGN